MLLRANMREYAIPQAMPERKTKISAACGESQDTIGEPAQRIAQDMTNENHVQREATQKIYARVTHRLPPQLTRIINV